MLSHFKVFEHPQGVRVQVLHTDMVFPGITIEQMGDGWRAYVEDEKYVQDAFSFLDAGQREFLMTGLLPGEFEELMAECGDPSAFENDA